ncbi:MAG: hypothetical protein ACO1QS_02190, partial [Verrucomicrobiota bacterium]
AAPAPAVEESTAGSTIANPHARKAYIPKDAPEPSFPRGMLGAAIGTVVGCLIWYAVYYFGEINFGFLALIPAVLAGVLGRLMAREDNTWIGVTAAVFTVLGIFGTNYAMAARELEKEFGGTSDSLFPSYDIRMMEAKEAAAAKTDDEIRAFLQNRNRKLFEKFADKGEKYKPESISKEEVDAFKLFEQKELQDFADGKPSREEYEKEISSAKKAGTWFARILTAVTAVISAGIFGIFSLIMAVSIAYRTGSG